MAINPAYHGGQVHRMARELGVSVSDIVDFSANINPLGPPRLVQQALAGALDDIRFYPDADQHQAKQAIGHRHGLTEATVLITNGATEAIDLVLRVFAPTRVYILDPAFSEYRAAAHRNRILVAAMPLKRPDFTPDWDQLVDRVGRGDAVIWNNPHNPSGRVAARANFAEPLRVLADRGAAVLVDESFMDFLPDDTAATAIPEALDPGSRIVVVRSLTKFFAIPGLRLGYAVSDPDWITGVEHMRDRWSVSHLAQKAASVGAADTTFATQTRQWLHHAHQEVAALWRESSWYRCQPTSVNFFLMRWNRPDLSLRLAQALYQRGLAVRVCDDFEGLGADYWRVAIRTSGENNRLYAAVHEVLGEVESCQPRV